MSVEVPISDIWLGAPEGDDFPVHILAWSLGCGVEYVPGSGVVTLHGVDAIPGEIPRNYDADLALAGVVFPVPAVPAGAQ